MQYSALIVAAGSGTRMKLGYNKVYAKLSDGTTILDKTLSVFLNDSDCVQIVLVTDCVEHFEKSREEKMVGLYLLVVERHDRIVFIMDYVRC